MKKNALILGIVVASCFLSCKGGGSFESDVRKMADMRCKLQKVEAKDQSDEKVRKEKEDIEKEMKEFSDKMEKKYADKKNDKEMDEKADKIMDEVMEKCK
jgi:hypothetical protein